MVVLEDVVLELGQIGLWVQAVGLIVILWIVFQAITMYYNRRRRLLLEEISTRLGKLERKLDSLKKR
ncbi:hypothetical protein J4416_02280 [Candidatus Pacearchaeota archaeon]|nr:hypothetical protein [Candidatus Pacearchaeota archaeon]